MSEAASGTPAEGHEKLERGDTRSRIQAIAVELFTEQGYDKTSLREIAEQLGVTKAALYYHFKSKDDILHSLVDDYFGQVDALIAWGQSQRGTPGVHEEILARYLDIVIGGHKVYQMLHQNQAALSSMTSIKERGQLFRERMNSIIDLLTGPGASLRERVRAAMAASGLSFGWMLFHDEAGDSRELRSVVLGVARELAGCGEPATATLSAVSPARDPADMKPSG
ncbi:MAG TPA: TetR/AcrR family transcriptional regulator [Streptosporangiaceae bacterium]